MVHEIGHYTLRKKREFNMRFPKDYVKEDKQKKEQEKNCTQLQLRQMLYMDPTLMRMLKLRLTFFLTKKDPLSKNY